MRDAGPMEGIPDWEYIPMNIEFVTDRHHHHHYHTLMTRAADGSESNDDDGDTRNHGQDIRPGRFRFPAPENQSFAASEEASKTEAQELLIDQWLSKLTGSLDRPS